jgi:hypothetical protein
MRKGFRGVAHLRAFDQSPRPALRTAIERMEALQMSILGDAGVAQSDSRLEAALSGLGNLWKQQFLIDQIPKVNDLRASRPGTPIMR